MRRLAGGLLSDLARFFLISTMTLELPNHPEKKNGVQDSLRSRNEEDASKVVHQVGLQHCNWDAQYEAPREGQDEG